MTTSVNRSRVRGVKSAATPAPVPVPAPVQPVKIDVPGIGVKEWAKRGGSLSASYKFRKKNPALFPYMAFAGREGIRYGMVMRLIFMGFVAYFGIQQFFDAANGMMPGNPRAIPTSYLPTPDFGVGVYTPVVLVELTGEVTSEVFGGSVGVPLVYTPVPAVASATSQFQIPTIVIPAPYIVGDGNSDLLGNNGSVLPVPVVIIPVSTIPTSAPARTQTPVIVTRIAVITGTPSITPTVTPSPEITAEITDEPTLTPSATLTIEVTDEPTQLPTITPDVSTNTPEFLQTDTPAPSETPQNTLVPTLTLLPQATFTATFTPTIDLSTVTSTDVLEPPADGGS